MHESIWKPQAARILCLEIGETPPTRHPADGIGQKSKSSSGGSGRLCTFCRVMATSLSGEWCEGFGSPTCSWLSLHTLFPGEKEAEGADFKGASSFGVCP